MEVNISNKIIIAELDRRGWGYDWFSKNPQMLRVYKPGVKEGTVITPLLSEYTNSIGEVVAKKKLISYRRAAEEGIDHPSFIKYSDDESAVEFLNLHKRVVVKPESLAHGDGVKIDVCDKVSLLEHIAKLRRLSGRIIIQQQVQGEDLRILFIGDKYVGSLARHPASITGDGVHSVEEIISTENLRPARGSNYRKQLNFIDIEMARDYLGGSLSRVPDEGEKVRVIGVANVGAGGSARSINDDIHPEIVRRAAEVKEKMMATHAGVDFMIEDFTRPPSESNRLYFIEINSRPYLGFHQNPNIGPGVDVAKVYVDWLDSQMGDRV